MGFTDIHKKTLRNAQQVDLQAIGAWSFIVPTLRKMIRIVWQSGGLKNGVSKSWYPLSKSTQEQKDRDKKYGRKLIKKITQKGKIIFGKQYYSIMKRSGKLQNNAEQFTWQGKPQSMLLQWSAKSQRGFDYAGFHQRGWNSSPIYSSGHGGRPVELSPTMCKQLAERLVHVLRSKISYPKHCLKYSGFHY